MAETSIRLLAIRKLVTLLRAHASLAGVQVEPGWPGDDARPETIWIEHVTGEVNIPLFGGGGRFKRDDTFSLPVRIMVADKVSMDATYDRIIAMVAAVEDVFADDPSFDGLDGTIDAQVTSEMTQVVRTPDGPAGFAEVVVTVHARLV